MLFYDYKGYTIYPAPRLVAGSGRWKIGGIMRLREITVIMRTLTLKAKPSSTA